jgi:hypothetical protein
VALVEGRERRKGRHRGERLLIDQHRRCEAPAAMNDPVPDRGDGAPFGGFRLVEDARDQGAVGLRHFLGIAEPSVALDLSLGLQDRVAAPSPRSGRI